MPWYRGVDYKACKEKIALKRLTGPEEGPLGARGIGAEFGCPHCGRANFYVNEDFIVFQTFEPLPGDPMPPIPIPPEEAEPKVGSGNYPAAQMGNEKDSTSGGTPPIPRPLRFPQGISAVKALECQRNLVTPEMLIGSHRASGRKYATGEPIMETWETTVNRCLAASPTAMFGGL